MREICDNPKCGEKCKKCKTKKSKTDSDWTKVLRNVPLQNRK